MGDLGETNVGASQPNGFPQAPGPPPVFPTPEVQGAPIDLNAALYGLNAAIQGFSTIVQSQTGHRYQQADYERMFAHRTFPTYDGNNRNLRHYKQLIEIQLATFMEPAKARERLVPHL